MGDFGVVITLGVLYAILSVLGKFAKSGKAPNHAPPPRKRVAGKPETLEDLLAEMRGEVERVTEPAAPEPEEARSLELADPRAARVPVNYDQEAEALIASRIRGAAARDHALSAADHARFDRKVRQVAPVVVVDTRRRDALRKAVVWSEILGTPKGLQED